MARKIITLLFLIVGLSFFVLTPVECKKREMKQDVVYVQQKTNLKRILKKKNRRFIIENQHDLSGKTINVGKNSVLEFDGGSFQNGAINGNGTRVAYNRPFFGENLTIQGCCIIDKDVIEDVDVFTVVHHTQREIQGLFDLSGGIPISFSKGIYRDVTPVVIRNNIEADFNNSTLYANVTNKKSSTVFSCGKQNCKDYLDYVHIKNLQIDGGIEKTEAKQKLPENRPSPCIQLFYVNDIVLDNVDISQFNPGTEDLKYMTHSYRDVYENYLVAMMYGITAKVTNCDVSYCLNEGFKFAPAINANNFIEFTNNTSQNRYWTFLEVDDGRCLVKNNIVEGASSSAFNLYCYESEICNNTFRNSIRGCAIDLSEPSHGGGVYRSYDVAIHDNKCYNYPQLLEMWAGKVDVYNNYIDGVIIKKTNSAGCIVRMLNKYKEINEWSFRPPFNNPGGQDDYTKDIQIHNNVFDGEFKAGIILGNRLSTKAEGENLIIRSNQFLDTMAKEPNYCPVQLFCVKDIRIEDNKIGVLKYGTYHSPSDNVYFYCDRCSGELVAKDNNVSKKKENGNKYVFSIASSQFDKATIIDDSKHGFYLHYTPSSYSGVNNAVIFTNCGPLPGTKFGKEVQLIKKCK